MNPLPGQLTFQWADDSRNTRHCHAAHASTNGPQSIRLSDAIAALTIELEIAGDRTIGDPINDGTRDWIAGIISYHTRKHRDEQTPDAECHHRDATRTEDH